jgi:hypothetical protein
MWKYYRAGENCKEIVETVPQLVWMPFNRQANFPYFGLSRVTQETVFHTSFPEWLVRTYFTGNTAREESDWIFLWFTY